MNLKIKQMRHVAVSAIWVCLTPLLMNAEHISFNLPVKAHWGSAILQPGEYTFDIPLASSWPQEIDLLQNDNTIRIYPIIESGDVQSTQDYLLLIEAGDSYFVREYVSGTTGKKFTFGRPKDLLPALSVKATGRKIPTDSQGH